MDITSRPVVLFRWVTFLAAAAYCVYQLLTSNFGNPGGPFRFLTIWALFLSCYSASRMLAFSYGRAQRPHLNTAAVTAVLNVMVVYLYWKLFFIDPKLVQGGNGIPWHKEYYLHGIGPLLQIFDALFIARAFRSPLRAAVPLISVIVIYVAWAELFVQRYNTVPSGSITNGLPYPFLNSLELGERAMFYLGNCVVALLVLGGLTVVSWGTARVLRRAAPGQLS